MRICISFRSSCDLVLDDDHAFVFLGPISFYRRVSRFVVFQTKVARLCFRLVRIKMTLLMCWHMCGDEEEWPRGGVGRANRRGVPLLLISGVEELSRQSTILICGLLLYMFYWSLECTNLSQMIVCQHLGMFLLAQPSAEAKGGPSKCNFCTTHPRGRLWALVAGWRSET